MATATKTARMNRPLHPEIPPNWSFQRTPLGIEMEYQFRDRATRATVFAVGMGCLGFFGYWIFQILRALLENPSSLEWGGIVFLLLSGGGLAFGLYCLARLLARTHYQIGPGVLRLNEYLPGRTRTIEIHQGSVESLTCVCSRNPRPTGEDTYKLIINWRNAEAGSKWIAMEGSSKQEALWLGTILSEWSGKEVTEEHSGL